MISEAFASGNSILHAIDPRIKVVLALIYSFVVALSSSFVILLSSLATASVLVMLARLDVKEVLKRFVLPDIAVPFLDNGFRSGGEYRLGRDDDAALIVGDFRGDGRVIADFAHGPVCARS